MDTAKSRFDIVIIGGGIMGSSVAYFLKQRDPSMEIAVIEPDPTYEFASTVRASGGARRLFSCPENIEMSNFSIDFIKRFPEDMAIDGEPAHVDWIEQGYLFIVNGPEPLRALEENAQVQRSKGADIVLLDRVGLRRLFPSMYVDDLDGAAYSPGDGWCDPSSFLQGMRKKARSLGVDYIAAKVTGFTSSDTTINGVTLDTGHALRADILVNAAGAWAGQVSAMAGMALPISPLRRFEHFFTGHRKIEPLPYVKDLSRLAFRPGGCRLARKRTESRWIGSPASNDFFHKGPDARVEKQRRVLT